MSEDLKLSRHLTFDRETAMARNLTDRFTKEDLDNIGGWVWDGYFRDKMSRAKWERRTEAALDLALQVQKVKTFPWPGASNVVFPVITIAALQFSSKSYTNIIQGTDVVRYRVIKDDPAGLVKKRADRIGAHMSWQVLEEDEAWEEQHDRLLINLSIVGTNFVKTYYCDDFGGPTSELVHAQDFVLDYFAKSVDSAERKTHVMRVSKNEIWSNSARGIWRDVRDEEWFGQPPVYVTYDASNAKKDNREGLEQPQTDSTSAYRLLEQHVNVDFDGDGYAEPYIITIEEQSRFVCRIVSRVDDFDKQVDFNGKGELLCIRPSEYFTKYGFIPSPDGSIYDLGFGTFLGPINETIDSGVNQLMDMGTLMTSIGGFLGKGAKIRGGVYTMAPWEWKRVESTGDDLKKSLVPYPKDVGGTPEVLFKLVGLLIQYAERVAGTTDVQVGENPGQNTPAETFRGMQEQGMAVYGTIFKRVWRSMKDEFRKRYLINRYSLRAGVPKRFGTTGLVRAEDYQASEDEVAPVADPNIPSTTMRVQQALALADRALAVPGYEIEETERNLHKALRIQNSMQIYPGPGNAKFQMPNPKMAVEQGKQQLKAMELRYKAFELMRSLAEQHRLNSATIDKLKAESAKIISSIGTERAATVIKGFEAYLNVLEKQSQYLTQQQQGLEGMANDSGGDGGGAGGQAQPGGTPQLAAPSSDPSSDGGPPAVAA